MFKKVINLQKASFTFIIVLGVIISANTITAFFSRMPFGDSSGSGPIPAKLPKNYKLWYPQKVNKVKFSEVHSKAHYFKAELKFWVMNIILYFCK